MPNEYKKSWVYVLPFRETLYIPPLPFTMIEAMSYSVPVVSTAMPQFKELLPKKYLIGPEDYKTLASKIDQIFSEKQSVSLPMNYFPEEIANEFIELVLSNHK